LADALVFLKESYKTILACILLGLCAAVIYIIGTPREFEATAQISIAQTATELKFTPSGINIEEPLHIISRMTIPTSFSGQAIKDCGFDGVGGSGEALARAIKLAPVKGLTNVLVLKVVSSSPESAKLCANAIFELIKVTQAEMLAPYNKVVQARLIADEVRLEKARAIISNADKFGSAMSAAYLSTRDEIRFLTEEISTLQAILSTNMYRATRLNSPIYVSDSPINPKKWLVLSLGLFTGLVLGLSIAFCFRVWARLKARH